MTFLTVVRFGQQQAKFVYLLNRPPIYSIKYHGFWCDKSHTILGKVSVHTRHSGTDQVDVHEAWGDLWRRWMDTSRCCTGEDSRRWNVCESRTCARHREASVQHDKLSLAQLPHTQSAVHWPMTTHSTTSNLLTGKQFKPISSCIWIMDSSAFHLK